MNDITEEQGAGMVPDLDVDDVYIQFGGDLFVKAGYYDGVGDDIYTADATGQGDTVGMGYGIENLSFAVDVLLDSDDDTDDFVEGVGAEVSYTLDNFKIYV